MYNVTINLGNIWEALSAVGTISATIIALWLGLRKPRKKLDIVMVWEFVTKSKPIIYLSNPTFYTIAIKSIEIIYNKKQVAYLELTQNVRNNYTGIITSNETKKFAVEKLDLNCVSFSDDSTDDLKHKLKIIVKDVSNYKYIKTMIITERDVKKQKVGELMLNTGE